MSTPLGSLAQPSTDTKSGAGMVPGLAEDIRSVCTPVQTRFSKVFREALLLSAVPYHIWTFLVSSQRCHSMCNKIKFSGQVFISFPSTSALEVTYLQVRNAITFPQSDLENLQRANEGCQSGQALLAASAHANQESVSSGGLQDTVDAATKLKHTKSLINKSIFLFLYPVLFNTYFIH